MTKRTRWVPKGCQTKRKIACHPVRCYVKMMRSMYLSNRQELFGLVTQSHLWFRYSFFSFVKFSMGIIHEQLSRGFKEIRTALRIFPSEKSCMIFQTKYDVIIESWIWVMDHCFDCELYTVVSITGRQTRKTNIFIAHITSIHCGVLVRSNGRYVRFGSGKILERLV